MKISNLSWFVVFLIIFLVQGCSSKYVQNIEHLFHKKTPQATQYKKFPPYRGSHRHHRIKRESKKIAQKVKLNKKAKLNKLFPKTTRLGPPIPVKKVKIIQTSKIPKSCHLDGWLSFSIPQGIVYQSAFLPDIVKARQKENTLIKQIAALNGIEYVYNYLDGSKIKYRVVDDPVLKKRVNILLTPTKRVMIYKKRIYKEAVRILRCKKLHKGTK